METRICQQCGRELPLSEFKRGKAHGTEFITKICKSCCTERYKDSRKAKKEKTIKDLQEQVEQAKALRLEDFTPRELMERLRDLGYTGKLNYVETHTIDLSTM